MLPLEEKHVLITSGPTRGYLDSVRYISNRSSGELGSKITIRALDAGANVTMVYGTGSTIPKVHNTKNKSFQKLSLINIETNEDLISTIENKLKGIHFDVIIHAMAVLDFTPEKKVEGKTSSDNLEWTIKLCRTQKVIKLLKKRWPNAYFVGFKLEVNKTEHELIDRVHLFSKENKTDLVVANDLNDITETGHKCYVINRSRKVEAIYHNKDEIASGLIKLLIKKI